MKELLHEGNIRRIVIKQGERTVIEIPLTVGAVTALIAPWLAAVGALAAYVSDCTIDVERTDQEPPKAESQV
jgi:predicted methyltransferase